MSFSLRSARLALFNSSPSHHSIEDTLCRMLRALQEIGIHVLGKLRVVDLPASVAAFLFIQAIGNANLVHRIIQDTGRGGYTSTSSVLLPVRSSQRVLEHPA